MFDLFDVDKNGVIDGREMAAMAKVLGYHLDKEQVKVSHSHLYCFHSNKL